jgi:hypothetical protein
MLEFRILIHTQGQSDREVNSLLREGWQLADMLAIFPATEQSPGEVHYFFSREEDHASK